ncbi:MAG: PspC domain-containing protein [Flavitalea sp.]
MKKVININFQGRVIPIEETAYESLKQYVESLRKYFAQEEGRDEIINDIESRIAELFSERLKKGLTCITDEDVEAVIRSMGRPSDFEAQDAENMTGSTQNKRQSASAPLSSYPGGDGRRGRLFRNVDDKILGGVCSGLANYFRIDPVIMRILFVLLSGILFWVYVLLWIIVPSQSIQSNITKRLHRSPEHKVIGGVCGGIAAYFNIDIWVPRLIFALPFLLAVVSGGFHSFLWNWDFGFIPRLVSGSFGSTMFVTYVILWIAVPLATSAADKLEMRGERVDLNSIRDTVKEDLENFKTKAEKWGSEVKDSAQQLGLQAKQFGQDASAQAKYFASEAAPVARKAGSGLGHAIGVLFKAFFLFIASIVAISLFGAFIGLLFGGFALAPLKNFILAGAFQNLLFWSGLFLFFGVPLVALITWVIRRIMGVRSKNHYLGYIFGGLFIIGLVSVVTLVAMVGGNFSSRSRLSEEQVSIVQPSKGKFFFRSEIKDWKSNHHEFFGFDMDDDFPFYDLDQDSVRINTIRVSMAKSSDSAFHVYRVRSSRGNTISDAAVLAGKIQYEPIQRDSILELPRTFSLDKKDKFRNQRVMIVVEIPVGKKVQFDRNIRDFIWFEINHDRNGFRVDDNWHDREDLFNPEPGAEYMMTTEGRPDRTDKKDDNDDDKEDASEIKRIQKEEDSAKNQKMQEEKAAKDQRIKEEKEERARKKEVDNQSDSSQKNRWKREFGTLWETSSG